MRWIARCPNNDLLTAFVEGSLEKRPFILIARHIKSCDACAYLTGCLRTSDGPETNEDPWPAAHRRLSARFSRFLGEATGKRDRKSRMWRIAVPVFASIVFFIAGTLVRFGRQSQIGLPASVLLRNLDAERGKSIVRASTARSEGTHTVVTFFYPVRSKAIYSVEIYNAVGQRLFGPVQVESYNDFGDFAVDCGNVVVKARGGRLVLTEKMEGEAGHSQSFPL